MKLKSLFIILSLSLTLLGCGNDGDSNSSPQNPQEETSGPSSGAGKVSLWKLPEAYDSAVFLPAEYGVDETKFYPMVLSLHGYNGSVLNTDHTAVGGEKSGFIKQVWSTPLANTYPAIVIAPHVYPVGQNENSLWNHERLRALIEEALQKYRIDPRRISVTGYSAGSIAAQELALRSKDLIAGVMPGAFEGILKIDPCAVEDLPVWAFGNSSDPVFQPTSWREIQSAVESCPGYTQEFQLSIYQNSCGHGCWDDHWSRPEVQSWLLNPN